MVGIFTKMADLPEDFVNYLFNLNPGGRISAHCKKDGRITEQVTLSYSDLPALHNREWQRLLGRILNMLPFAPFIGRPAVCRCGTVNRV